jgi:hypothetical protein
MPYWQAIAVAVAVVVLVLALYLSYSCGTGCRPDVEYQKSNGTADRHAIRALEGLARKSRLRPRDRILRANLQRFNILGDETVTITPDTRERIVHNIANDYAAALQEMAAPQAADRHDMTLADEDFAIHQMLQFAELFEIGAAENTGMGAGLTHGVGVGAGAHMLLGHGFAVAAPDIVNRSVEERRAAAMTAESPAAASEAFFDASIRHTSNPQNVHDSGVNADLRRTLARLRKYESATGGAGSPHTAAVESAREYIRDTYARESPSRAVAALRILEEVQKGGTISTFSDTEDAIFATVWARASGLRGQRDTARIAVCDALADSLEGGGPVCINGRTSRVLNSLATIDPDPIISNAAMTTEAYRNQIFRETQDLVASAARTAADSGDANVAAVGKAYMGVGNATVDPAAERAFIDGVKAEIDKNLENYREKFTAAEFAKLRTECHAGVDF